MNDELKEISVTKVSSTQGDLSGLKHYPVTVLIIDDQPFIIEAIRRMLADQSDMVIHACTDPSKALQKAIECKPTVILQDLVMPEIDGLTLITQFRSNSNTKDIPMIVLSVTEEPIVKAKAFELGANDYIVKLPNKLELIARIRYHSNSYIHLLQRNEMYTQLLKSQKNLRAELSEAALYVKSLLPAFLEAPVKASWIFIPSAHLGGDAFGYHWIDSENLAMYLLDVMGHGIGAALLSISIVNVLRARSIGKIDFKKPDHVLEALNKNFPMEEHNNMFFSIWYGVYNKNSRNITFSCGGHPPAILLTGNSENDCKIMPLHTSGVVVGCTNNATYTSSTVNVNNFNKLYLFSDGVYEIPKPDNTLMSYKEFIPLLEQPSVQGIADLDRILKTAQQMNNFKPFIDDFSIVQFII